MFTAKFNTDIQKAKSIEYSDGIRNIVALSELLTAVAWLSVCLRKHTNEAMWAAYHKQLVMHLQSPGVPSSVMATLSRRLMERGSATQAAVPHTTDTEHVCISDDDKDIIEYIAGFVLHRIRQKAYRLKCGMEKTATLELVGALVNNADESTSTLIKCQQRGGLLSAHANLICIFNKFEFFFRQSTHHSTITTEIPLPDLIQTAINDTSITKLYDSCVSNISVITSRKNSMFRELASIYFMVRVNGFCRQTMEQYRQRHKMYRRAKALRKSLQ